MNNTQAQGVEQKGFVVDSRAFLGMVEGLGYVAVLTDRDEGGNVTVKELDAGHGRGRESTTSADSVRRLSNKPGSANSDNSDESELNMARRLAGRNPSDSPRQNDHPVALYGRTGQEDSRMKVVTEGGNLYVRTARISDNPFGTVPLTVVLKPLESSTDPILGDDGKPTGRFLTTARYVIVAVLSN